MPEYTGKLSDPAFRRERARRAGLSRTSLDYHVAQVIERAPALTAEQIDRLRALLPADEGGDGNGQTA